VWVRPELDRAFLSRKNQNYFGTRAEINCAKGDIAYWPVDQIFLSKLGRITVTHSGERAPRGEPVEAVSRALGALLCRNRPHALASQTFSPQCGVLAPWEAALATSVDRRWTHEHKGPPEHSQPSAADCRQQRSIRACLRRRGKAFEGRSLRRFRVGESQQRV